MGIEVYSQTPASNDLANYFQTGMAPSKVKNAGWDIMADMAQQLLGMPTTGGTANAQTATNTRQFGSLVAGMMQYVVFGATNTAAMTFAPDGLTAKNVFANGAAALAGQIVSGQIGILKYDGTQWNLLNPSRVTGSYTGTGTGYAATVPTATINYAISPDGQTVTLSIPVFNGTSNATTATVTGGPAVIQPTTTQGWNCAIADNGTATISGNMSIVGGTATLSFGNSAIIGTTGGFTNTGTKVVPRLSNSAVFTVNYPRNP